MERLRELECSITKTDGVVTTVTLIGCSAVCNYRNPKDKHMHGQFCRWGYEDSLSETQCIHYRGGKIKTVDGIETVFVKCALVPGEDNANKNQ